MGITLSDFFKIHTLTYKTKSFIIVHSAEILKCRMEEMI